jgi:hypothetical protein
MKNRYRPSHILILLLCLFVILRFASLSQGSVRAQSGNVSKIIFIEINNAGQNILSMMDPDGKNVVRLVQLPYNVRDFKLSPDGTTIAYSGEVEQSRANLFLMDVTGAHQRRVKKPEDSFNDSAVSWSPDGKQLIYYIDGGGIHTVNPDGTNDQAIPLPQSGDIPFIDTPIWLPDGQHILFSGGKLGGAHLYSATLTGTDLKQVVKVTLGIFPYTALSADGKQIAFVGNLTPDNFASTQIFIANADGSNEKPLPNGEFGPTLLAWSPDSKQIAYVGNGGITVVNADGTNAHAIMPTNPTSKYLLAWGSIPAQMLQNLTPFVTLVASTTPIPSLTPTTAPTLIPPTLDPASLDMTTATLFTSSDSALKISVPKGWTSMQPPTPGIYQFSNPAGLTFVSIGVGKPSEVYSYIGILTPGDTPKETFQTWKTTNTIPDYTIGDVTDGTIGTLSGSTVALKLAANAYQPEITAEFRGAVLSDGRVVIVSISAPSSLWASLQPVFYKMIDTIQVFPANIPTLTPTSAIATPTA